MKKAVARLAGRVKREETEKKAPPVGTLNYSLQELEERASTKTELLISILNTQESPRFRHWGINE